MIFFVTGTDTNVGKTIISAWLCHQAGYSYWKPIQTGSEEGTDSAFIRNIIPTVTIYKEAYCYKLPLSPHLAARLEGEEIDLSQISIDNLSVKKSPTNNGFTTKEAANCKVKNLIIEGAGGVLTPINKTSLMVDLIIKLQVPVLLVCRPELGTINHTLLTVEALRKRKAKIAGVIMNGRYNEENAKAIEHYGKISVIANFPQVLLPGNYHHAGATNLPSNEQTLTLKKAIISTPLSQILMKLLCLT